MYFNTFLLFPDGIPGLSWQFVESSNEQEQEEKEDTDGDVWQEGYDSVYTRIAWGLIQETIHNDITQGRHDVCGCWGEGVGGGCGCWCVDVVKCIYSTSYCSLFNLQRLNRLHTGNQGLTPRHFLAGSTPDLAEAL